MRVAIYCRTARLGQTNSSQLQEEVVRRYCQQQGLEVVAVYMDDGFSGTTALWDRPGGAQLLEAAKSRRFDAVALASIDRLARSQKYLLSALETLEALTIQCVIPQCTVPSLQVLRSFIQGGHLGRASTDTPVP
jgi:site-specific DNA recombinase